jgi:hypothetical protein
MEAVDHLAQFKRFHTIIYQTTSSIKYSFVLLTDVKGTNLKIVARANGWVIAAVSRGTWAGKGESGMGVEVRV